MSQEINYVLQMQKEVEDNEVVYDAAVRKTPGSITSEGVNEKDGIVKFLDDVKGAKESILAKIEKPVLSATSFFSAILNSARSLQDGVMSSITGKVDQLSSSLINKVGTAAGTIASTTVNALNKPLTNVQAKFANNGKMLTNFAGKNLPFLKPVTETISNVAKNSIFKTIISATPAGPYVTAASALLDSIEEKGVLNSGPAALLQKDGALFSGEVAAQKATDLLTGVAKTQLQKVEKEIFDKVNASSLYKKYNKISNILDQADNAIEKIESVLNNQGEKLPENDVESNAAQVPTVSLDDIKKAEKENPNIVAEDIALVFNVKTTNNITEVLSDNSSWASEW